MGDLFKNLSLDYWYKVLLLLSCGVFVLAISVPLQIPNIPVVIMSLGGIFIGMGEWINHPYQEAVNLHAGLKISGYVRKAGPLGVLFDVIGGILLVYGIWKLL